jgi:hypothetical protein
MTAKRNSFNNSVEYLLGRWQLSVENFQLSKFIFVPNIQKYLKFIIQCSYLFYNLFIEFCNEY